MTLLHSSFNLFISQSNDVENITTLDTQVMAFSSQVVNNFIVTLEGV
jgi:hypothetical protein